MKASIVTVLVLFPCLSMSMLRSRRPGVRGGFFTMADPSEYKTYITGPGGIPIQIDTPDPDLPDISESALLHAALAGPRFDRGPSSYYDLLYDRPQRAPVRRRPRGGIRRRRLIRGRY